MHEEISDNVEKTSFGLHWQRYGADRNIAGLSVNYS